MAEAKVPDAKEAAAAKPQGGAKKLILGVVIGVLVAGGGATGAFLFLGKKSQAAEKDGHGKADAAHEEKAHKKKGKHTEPGPVEKMNPFVVNLRDAQSSRYLKTTLEFEVGNEKELEKFKKYSSAIRHDVLMYLSNLSVAEIQGEGGRQIIAKELLAKVRKIFEVGEVRNLYITEFVLQ